MKYLLKILLLTSLCIACHSDLEDEKIPHGMTKASIGFKAAVDNTRAIVENDTPIKNNGFSVWGGYEGNAPVFDGRKVTFNSTNNEWEYTEEEYWTYNTYNFHAVYPSPEVGAYTSAAISNGIFTIEGFDATKEYDLLYANQFGIDGSNPPSSVDFQFKHLLTKVSLSLTLHEDNKNDVITVTGAYLSGLYTKGSYTNGPNTTESWVNLDNSSYVGKETNTRLTYGTDQPFIENHLMIPQTFSGEHTVYLVVQYTFTQQGSSTTSNKSLVVPLPYSTQWTINTSIAYKATVHVDHNIEFAIPSVEEWGSEQAGGTIIIK